MPVKFQTKAPNKYTWKPEIREQKMNDFGEYLQAKYEYISKMEMLKSEKKTRQAYGLTVGEAAKVWNKIYRD